MKKDYSKFTDYFKRNGFNTIPYLLKILSYLPPADRIEILESLIEFFPNNVNLYDKLSMATLKNGNYDKAIKIIEEAYRRNNLNRDYYNQLKGKIDFLHKERKGRYGSSNDYQMTLSLLRNDMNQGFDMSWGEKAIVAYKEFCAIMEDFCNSQIK